MTEFDDRRNPSTPQPNSPHFSPEESSQFSQLKPTGRTEAAEAEKDPVFLEQVQRLHHFTVYSRWLFVGALWVLIAPISLWALRSEFALWRDYFTWTAVRYTIVYNRLPSIGLILCIALTIAILVWQSRNILWGLPQEYVRRLEEQVLQIRRQGKSHPLWRWVCEK